MMPFSWPTFPNTRLQRFLSAAPATGSLPPAASGISPFNHLGVNRLSADRLSGVDTLHFGMAEAVNGDEMTSETAAHKTTSRKSISPGTLAGMVNQLFTCVDTKPFTKSVRPWPDQEDSAIPDSATLTFTPEAYGRKAKVLLNVVVNDPEVTIVVIQPISSTVEQESAVTKFSSPFRVKLLPQDLSTVKIYTAPPANGYKYTDEEKPIASFQVGGSSITRDKPEGIAPPSS